MDRSRFIYLTDLMLVPVFVLSFYTGIELHIAGHGTDHEVWHNWAVFHVVTSLLFMLLGFIHMKSHWKWYKGLAITGRNNKLKIVMLLSIVFISLVATGIGLFFVHGANSPLGLCHYQNGLILSILGLQHIFKRRQFLFRGFTPHIFGKKKELK